MSIGLCIEAKYPTSSQDEKYSTRCIPEPSHFVDHILKTVYDNSSGRSIIFCSSSPFICTILNWKQPNYGVFFKSHCGFSVTHSKEVSPQEPECRSIKVRFNAYALNSSLINLLMIGGN